jgi:arginyl-tRNA synthetase
MRLSTGKMSSRKGNFVSGESLIIDAIELAKSKMIENRGLSPEEAEKVATMVGVAGLKYAILRQSLGKDIAYDVEKSLSFEGDSGPYLQYAHARAMSILGKAKAAGVPSDPTAISEVEADDLICLFPRFPEVVLRAAEEFEPHHIATYLIELSAAFNSWYAAVQILDGTPEASYKVALTEAFSILMKNGLYLLGIKAPEKM